jgi:phosphatidate cytidylyltransferase
MPDNTALSEAPHGGAPGSGGFLSSNLRMRIVSGLALAVLAFVLTWAGTIPFALLVGLVALFVSWEWGRMVRGESADLAFYIHAAGLVLAIALSAAGYAALGLAALAAAAIVLVPLVFGRGARLSALGVLYSGVPSVALVWLRDSEPYGLAAVLVIFAVVWGSDTAAYASGRLIGGAKLWPRISPNKTWAGLIGALCAGATAGAVASLLIPDAATVRLAVLGLVLSLIAQGGDLAESALKRLFGRKDASDLIPGHGGFMDRVDSIVAAATASGILALAIGPHMPARAFIIGG